MWACVGLWKESRLIRMVGVTKAVIVGFTNLAVTGTPGSHPKIMMWLKVCLLVALVEGAMPDACFCREGGTGCGNNVGHCDRIIRSKQKDVL
jgi:hypothetical protein